MYQNSKTNTITSTPNWIQILDSTKRDTAFELNCVRVGIVQAVNYDSLTVDVLIANKRTLAINKDGTQEVENFPLIRAKIVFCNPFITNPINIGDECILLFNDREIESWFINGGINAEAHPRMHSLTDAVAIMGIRSLPKMIETLTNALHLFYGASELIMGSDTVTLNATNVNINGNLTINGTPYLSHIHSNGNMGANTGGVVE